MGLQLEIVASVQGSYTAAADLENVAAGINVKSVIDFTTGAGALQADRLFSDNRTLAASTAENLDVNGVLADAFGSIINALRVKAILIRANAANANDVVIGNAGTDTLATLFGTNTDTIHVRPGGLMLIVAPDATGYVVTATTGDLLKVANGGSGTSVNYDVVIVAAAE